MGLSFTIAAGPRQRSRSQARVPRDSWSYFTVSDLRLPKLRGLGSPIYVLQELGDPVIPRALGSLFVAYVASQSQSHIATDGQSLSQSWCQAPSWAHDQIFITLSQSVLSLWSALSDERTSLSFVSHCLQ
jgi:hypothetical protein